MKKNDEFSIQEIRLRTRLTIKERIKINVISLVSLFKKISRPKLFFNIIIILATQLFSEKKINNQIRFLYSNSAIDYLLNSKKSLIRIGDGEVFHYLADKFVYFDQGFQEVDIELTAGIQKIIKEYKINSNYIIAVNNTIIQMSDLNLIKSGLYSLVFYQRWLFKTKLASSGVTTFLDASMFRPISNLSNNNIELLWLNKDIIIVHNNENEFIQFEVSYRKYSENIQLIKINATNTYKEINYTLLRTMQVADKFGKSNLVVLVSAGPAAKIIVYELSKQDIIAYDMGHYFKWKFKNSLSDGYI